MTAMGPKGARLLEILTELSYERRKVVLASGRESDFYIDARKTVLSAEGQYLTGSVMYQIVRSLFPEAEAVGGVVLGAAPLASAVSFASWLAQDPIPAFYLRKEPKAHGLGRVLEGPVQPGMKVVILEDVVTTGGSTLKALDMAAQEGLVVLGVVSLVDRQEGGGQAIGARTRFASVFTKEQIISQAEER